MEELTKDELMRRPQHTMDANSAAETDANKPNGQTDSADGHRTSYSCFSEIFVCLQLSPSIVTYVLLTYRVSLHVIPYHLAIIASQRLAAWMSR